MYRLMYRAPVLPPVPPAPQYLEEFMSTRLGVKRTAEVVAASQRTGADGQLYYDIQTRVRSYASRNQLAVSQEVSARWAGRRGGRGP